jgi:ribosome-binding factor A
MSERRRTYRVSERIRELVAGELHHLADPRFALVTITSVITSPDLRHAKVYWVVSDTSGRASEERKAEVQEAFESADGTLRRLLASELSVRFVPDLKFFYDDTFDEVAKVEELLAKVAAEGQNGGAPAGPVPINEPVRASKQKV